MPRDNGKVTDGLDSQVQPGSREEMRLLRMRSNWVNMAIALAVCLIVVLVALAFVPRPANELRREVDYVGIAESAQQTADFELAVPRLPDGWTSNEASHDPLGTPAVETWYVSWVGPERAWMSLRQSQGNENWVNSMLGEEMLQVGSRDVAGETFAMYQNASGDQALVGSAGDTTIVLKGTAAWETYDYFAQQILAQI